MNRPPGSVTRRPYGWRVTPPDTRPAYSAASYSYAEAREIADALGLAEPVAIALVRRGHRSAEAAREFLAAAERHDPYDFDSMAEAVGLVRAAIAAGRRITVHGDYDVDGVCATAILVAALRALGSDCDWIIPDRLADGYGLGSGLAERLRERRTGLLVTADCGIGSAAEVAAVRAAGIEAIVTDHHAPGSELPDCPILHPRLSGYPCVELCGAGVAHKLAAALRPEAAEADLDLVALATVADLVPLRGENRSLARLGIAELRRARRPGVRALIEAAGTDPEHLDEGDVAFRLAPRINAAGRLYRADAGVELMLTDDPGRATEIAAELDRANRERRDAETEVLRGAEAALAELPGGREAGALVVAGEGWHPGVVGIVASRLAEAHWRPTVVIGLDGGGRGRGSARSIPGYDLLAGLRACAGHLQRFGGHAAAAGLEIEAGRVEAFREALAADAGRAIAERGLRRSEAVDAVVGADGLGTEVAEQLQSLAPFGAGNPEVSLLVPWARVGEVRPMGEEGRHARFSVGAGPASARGVAFGVNGELEDAARAPHDLTVRLELNRWNGAVEPRVVLGAVHAPPGGPAPAEERRTGPRSEAPRDGEAQTGPDPEAPEEGRPAGGCADCRCRAGAEEWWRRAEAERSRPLGAWPPPELVEAADRGAPRRAIERPGCSAVAVVCELVSSGEPVVAICADASRRRALGELAADPARFGHTGALACGRSAAGAGRRGAERVLAAGSGLLLVDWGALALDPGLTDRFAHAVLVDPPPFAHLEALAASGPPEAAAYLHLAWDRAAEELASRVHRAEWDPRPALAEIYRGLVGAGGTASGAELHALLAGPGAHPLSPERAGRSIRILEELSLCRWEPDDAAPTLGVVSSQRTELDRSGTYVACRERLEEGLEFLESRRQAR